MEKWARSAGCGQLTKDERPHPAEWIWSGIIPPKSKLGVPEMLDGKKQGATVNQVCSFERVGK